MSRHVLVIGAGPAGLAAADAALRAGAEVTLVDSAPDPGGQFHRMLPAAYAAAHPERVQHDWRAFDAQRHSVLAHPRCTWLPETTVWAIEPEVRVHLLRGPADGVGRDRHVVEPDALVLATGAHDRVLPFPGWQLPGVFSAGAAQALAKGERIVVGERVLVAGTGPFLLPVAQALLDAGSRVLGVLEANRPSTLAKGWLARPWELTAQRGKAGELIGYAGTQLRHRVPYRTGETVIAARGEGRVEEVVVAGLRPDWSVRPGTQSTVAVDAVCLGHGFTPNLELPTAAGCAVDERGFVAVQRDQATSVARLYAAGEITGIAGAPAARAEGSVAGWVAAGGEPAAIAADLRAVAEGRRFAARLAAAHPIGVNWPDWLHGDTIICRCEETDYTTLTTALADPSTMDDRALRLATRAGLGPCQARMCGRTVAELSARLRGRPLDPQPHRRPIASPIRLGELAEAPKENTP